MAFTTAYSLAMVLFALLFVYVKARNTIVDWDLGKDYSNYSRQTYFSGDTITFQYITHTLDVVTKRDYRRCFSKNPIQSFDDGNTTITLTPGKMYFICNVAGHCYGDGGMHLQIKVTSSVS